ncbi:MAG: redox-regulated ATPase YchF [Acidobacteria bacterium]|nr:redox-regulated ATPase YchF [Acidobacteriota bacterium]
MLRAALIGYPSAGKTTLFQLMTSVQEAHRAHGRQDVQVGVARVPDERLDTLTALFNPRKRVPATVEFADLAAGGQSDARALVDLVAFRHADALLHVIRAFDEVQSPHPVGSSNPMRDATRMEEELILADLAVVEKRLERLEKDLKKGRTSELEQERDVLSRCRETLENGVPLRGLPLAGDDLKRLRGFQFLTAKPLLLVLNVDESTLTGGGGDASLESVVRRERLGEFTTRSFTRTVPVCAKIELEIAQLDPADTAAFQSDLGLSESGLDRVIRASYELLGYVSFFTVGEDECRAWSIPRSTPAQIAAAEIHSDIAHGFIRAEVVRYEDLIARGSLAACRDHAELRLEGKDYLVQDGDVINFRFAT